MREAAAIGNWQLALGYRLGYSDPHFSIDYECKRHAIERISYPQLFVIAINQRKYASKAKS